jgi:hypothetical protein
VSEVIRWDPVCDEGKSQPVARLGRAKFALFIHNVKLWSHHINACLGVFCRYLIRQMVLAVALQVPSIELLSSGFAVFITCSDESRMQC